MCRPLLRAPTRGRQRGCRRSHSCVGLALRCIRRGCDLRLLAVSHAASSAVVSARGASPPTFAEAAPDGQIADLRCLTARYHPGRLCGRLCGGAVRRECGGRSAAGCSTATSRYAGASPRSAPAFPNSRRMRCPGPVFDGAVPLAEMPDGSRAMDDRSALKVRITVRLRGPAARVWFLPCRVAPS